MMSKQRDKIPITIKQASHRLAKRTIRVIFCSAEAASPMRGARWLRSKAGVRFRGLEAERRRCVYALNNRKWRRNRFVCLLRMRFKKKKKINLPFGQGWHIYRCVIPQMLCHGIVAILLLVGFFFESVLILMVKGKRWGFQWRAFKWCAANIAI